MKWIDFKEWWFQRNYYSNRGLIDQIESVTEKDYCDISVKELEKFIEDLKDENND